VPVCDSILVQLVAAANSKCMEEDNKEEMEVSEDASPTNNGCEEKDELEKPAQRHVDSKKKQIDSDNTVEKIPPSSLYPTKRPLEVMSKITKPDRSKNLNVIRDIIGSTSRNTQKQGEKLNDHYINLLPWEGREISIPSTYSSNSITLSRTSDLPPPPKAVSLQSNLKLRFCPNVDNENNLSQSTPQVDASLSPTAAYCMDERRINSYKKLRPPPSFDTIGSDATSATASISVSSSSQPSSCNNPFLRLMDRDGNEENVYDEDDDVYDDEVSMLMRVVTEEGEDIDEEEDTEDDEGDHCDKQSEDATLTENVLLTEAIDWFEPVREEEVDEGKNLSSTQLTKNQNSIKSLDMIRSSSFSSSVQVEGASSGGDTEEAEDGGPSYCPDSPKRQSSLGSLDLIRSSSFSSSIRDTPTEDTGDNSVSGTSSSGVSGGLRKSLTWRIGVIGEGQKPQSEHEDSSSGRVSNSTTGTQLTPLTPLSLTRVSSPSSIDSTMTPSQYQWQERSLSSLSTSVSTGPTSYARSMPIRSNLKKKKRVWKIGKRNRSSKLQEQASPPTTLMEEEEQPPSPVKERNGIIKFTKDFPKHKGRRRADLNSYPHQCKQLIKKNHKAMLSEELFMKLADEDDFDEFIKLNRISFGGDMLLGRMLRERTRIQCKRDMLHNELEMYVKVHCSTLRTSGEKSVTANSEKSDERSVLFAI